MAAAEGTPRPGRGSPWPWRSTPWSRRAPRGHRGGARRGRRPRGSAGGSRRRVFTLGAQRPTAPGAFGAFLARATTTSGREWQRLQSRSARPGWCGAVQGSAGSPRQPQPVRGSHNLKALLFWSSLPAADFPRAPSWRSRRHARPTLLARQTLPPRVLSAEASLQCYGGLLTWEDLGVGGCGAGREADDDDDDQPGQQPGGPEARPEATPVGPGGRHRTGWVSRRARTRREGRTSGTTRRGASRCLALRRGRGGVAVSGRG